jgi:predicted negative regulator of RcsB-dependent stress response
MATRELDLEEQEQLAAFRAWWHDNVVLGLVAAASLGIAGWQGWHWYQRDQALQASALYEVLAKGARGGDARAVRDAGGELAERFPRTLYASLGALVTARFHFDRGDTRNARAQLQWVIERSGSDDLRDLARLRLAAVLLDEKSYDEALKLLEARPADSYAPHYAAARGEVFQAKGDPGAAKNAYREALEKAGPAGESLRAVVQLRLDALGG